MADNWNKQLAEWEESIGTWVGGWEFTIESEEKEEEIVFDFTIDFTIEEEGEVEEFTFDFRIEEEAVPDEFTFDFNE